jgi:hypothetical protein
MKHRFLLHSLSHTWLIVDITAIGLPNEIYPEEGKKQTVPALRFQNWTHVERYLRSQGADSDEIECLSVALKRYSVGVLTIV